MKRLPLVTLVGMGLLALATATAWAGPIGYTQTNLVSDIPGLALITDPNLKNPWGMSSSAGSPLWVSDQVTNVATLYSVNTGAVNIVPLTVTIPTTGTTPHGPTGQVFNSTTAFTLANGKPAAFIFANLDGTISAWNGGAAATIEANTAGAHYTGLAIANTSSGPMLYAANNASGHVDVFDGSFNPVTLGSGAFADPTASAAGLVPFNVQTLNGLIYVTYAPAGHTAQTSASLGQGAVAVFNLDGTPNNNNLIAPGGPLASPWGLALSPSDFGEFSNDLLVGNFSYLHSDINAFDPFTGAFLGTLTDPGTPIMDPGLWDLRFGNGGNGGLPDVLYFTAGINAETDGLFGSIAPAAVPEPATLTLTALGLAGIVRQYRRRRASR